MHFCSMFAFNKWRYEYAWLVTLWKRSNQLTNNRFINNESMNHEIIFAAHKSSQHESCLWHPQIIFCLVLSYPCLQNIKPNYVQSSKIMYYDTSKNMTQFLEIFHGKMNALTHFTVWNHNMIRYHFGFVKKTIFKWFN